MKTWGLYDTKDELWLGLERGKGPNLYTDHLLARAAATIATEQLGYLIVARETPSGVPRLKDSIMAKHSPEEAIQRIEGRVKPNDN